MSLNRAEVARLAEEEKSIEEKRLAQEAEIERLRVEAEAETERLRL